MFLYTQCAAYTACMYAPFRISGPRRTYICRCAAMRSMATISVLIVDETVAALDRPRKKLEMARQLNCCVKDMERRGSV